jgi:hypothetical protein
MLGSGINKELIALLDDFRIKSADDFYALKPGDQPYFVNRLYKALSRNTTETVQAAKADAGVKFHFQTSGDLTSAHPNVPSDVFLKKLAFYANRTFISFPFKKLSRAEESRVLKASPEHSWPPKRQRSGPFYFGALTTHHTPKGGVVRATGRKLYALDANAFRDFLTVTTGLRPALDAGASYVIPIFPDQKNLLRGRRLGLTPANFTKPELERQFWEEPAEEREGAERRSPRALSHLLLPHFSNVPFERILEIRTKESALYDDFQQRFARALGEASKTDSDARILEFLRDVDDGVRMLEARFNEIGAAYRRRNISLTLRFVAAGMVWMTPADLEVKKTITEMIGGLSAFEYVSARNDVISDKAALRSERFYLPWLVFNSSA